MKKALPTIFAFFAVLGIGWGIYAFYQNEIGQPPSSNQKQPLEQMIQDMSLDEKIGQMVMVGISGTDLNENEQTKALINRYHVGGIILYDSNIESTDQTRKLLNQLKVENKENPLPLFLGVDQEGGQVSRMPDPWAKIPSSWEIGQVNNPQFSYKIGESLGKELAALGFNMNFAPVLGIVKDPEQSALGYRSFGSNPKIVSSLGIKTMKGIQSQNIIPMVKHFPGLGDTSIDSHKGLPKINENLEQMRQSRLIPFSNAVKAGTDMVLVGHVLLPQIDSQLPTSLSKRVVTGILRKELNYNQVIITDDMTMGAIIKYYGIGQAAVEAVKAGNDIILVAHDYQKKMNVFQALKKSVQDGTISEKRLNTSVRRIIQLKQKYHLKDEKTKPIDIESINRSIHATLNKYMSE